MPAEAPPRLKRGQRYTPEQLDAMRVHSPKRYKRLISTREVSSSSCAAAAPGVCVCGGVQGPAAQTHPSCVLLPPLGTAVQAVARHRAKKKAAGKKAHQTDSQSSGSEEENDDL